MASDCHAFVAVLVVLPVVDLLERVTRDVTGLIDVTSRTRVSN